MKRLFVALLATLLITAGLSVSSGGKRADAATGDSLASFDAAVSAGIPPCAFGVGTGLAYDGTSLILSCWGSNVLERVNAVTHLNDGPITIGGLPAGADLQALAWDGTRGRLWACNAHSTVVLIDTATSTVDLSVTPFTVPACTDGLAYDGSDDTLWVSPDVSSTLYHYDTAGNQLGSFPLAGLLGACGNSGIAVGGPSLFLANNGCSQIYEVDKAVTTSSLFASFPQRLEDLECDGETFAPVSAIWSIDAYDRTLNAWEIPAGACGSGGLPQNDAPTVDITAPTDGTVVAAGTLVNLSATLTDPNPGDTHTCSINWGDGSTTAGTVAEAAGSGTCTDSHTYATPGVYTICVTVTDNGGLQASDCVMVVVYDPSAGFVTGGGWIDSPAGSYVPDASLTGRANFGFVSKYKKGATVPTGQTEFQFQAAGLNFHSDVYQWLIVAGARAQYKGTGSMNGVAGFGFLLTATDGQISGGGGVDKFRIKIWDTATSAVVYDNALGSSDDIDAANPQAISGGSIVIHK